MILDISDFEFRRIFQNPAFHLPIRWDGRDFPKTLRTLYGLYINELQQWYPQNKVKDIRRDCDLIVRAVNHYLNGFPDKAYNSMRILMPRLIGSPAGKFFQSAIDAFRPEQTNRRQPTYLFRATSVPDNQPYARDRIFHTPYNMRSCVSTCRYSIAGYPSLYLGTSLELCCEEIHLNPHKGFGITARFEPNLNYRYNDRPISFIDLAVKPQDFLREQKDDNEKGRSVGDHLLMDAGARGAYLSWYPLIAACSYIRVNKEHPFAAEYIIPQLLMQWTRSKMKQAKSKQSQLVGIRYFSCASVRASDMGFNYVFPTSGKQSKDAVFCPVLSNAFRLTKPYYLHEYSSIARCEHALILDHDLKFI